MLVEIDPYFVNIVYGLGHWLKDYGYYPKSWPLFTYMDHGITLTDGIPPHELNNDASLIFKFSPRLVEQYRKHSTKPVYNVLNPFVHYRKKHRIRKESEATGTLFFPAHSTEAIEDQTDWGVFIENLKTIPTDFGPVDICIHPTDIAKGLDKFFIDAGYKVYTAGSAYDYKFTENLYALLKKYQYTMSNIPGSYCFYSVEMGIPFSLWGQQPNYFNHGDKNIKSGAYTDYSENKAYQSAVALFTGLHTRITDEQRQFVELELGKRTTLGRFKTSILLYKALIHYMVNHKTYRRHISKLLFNRLTDFLLLRLVQSIKVFRYIWFLIALKVSSKSSDLRKVSENRLISSLELFKLKTTNRFVSMLFGKPIQIKDSTSYLESLLELSVLDAHRFNFSTKAPVIIDCNAGIGHSIIYFSRRFPGSRIIAFETDDVNTTKLKANLRLYNILDVVVENKSFWNSQSSMPFEPELDVSNSKSMNSTSLGDWANKNESQFVDTSTHDTRAVNLLLLTIDGDKISPLDIFKSKLMTVETVFIRYRTQTHSDNNVKAIMSALGLAGFNVSLHRPIISRHEPVHLYIIASR